MRLHLASGNLHKAAELSELARASAASSGQTPIEIISARAVGGMPHVVEDTGMFIGNARKKAQALKACLPAGALVLADDSGVCVDALDGGPGVESAYYAGPDGNPRANLLKLAEVMRDVPDDRRRAYFFCVLLVLTETGEERVFEGRCDGRLLREPRGGAGFGYDPLFVPDGYEQSYAELGDSVKSQISHRARAWAQLAEWSRQRPAA
ncbi:MAG: non-canonical purine NTP pyrophosphatase [Opitutus sp.]